VIAVQVAAIGSIRQFQNCQGFAAAPVAWLLRDPAWSIVDLK
jgi:hypothetical protein